MTRSRTSLELAAGKLTSAIQKEWDAEMGESASSVSEQVMYASHELLRAAKTGSLVPLLGAASVSEFLGIQWVQAHANVRPFIRALETAASGASRA